MKSLLKKLKIKTTNPGACAGSQWLKDAGAKPLVSTNPTTGKPIASVLQTTPKQYEAAIKSAQIAFMKWQQTPAPKRGEVVRQLGMALRQYKEPLGDLVSLEMGKIRAEGHGEVQEMIDICDFAVGLSRQLYGLTIASERPQHRMLEQWHPLGPIGVITAFNFPVAVWSWNAAIAAVCGDPVVWKPSSLTPLTAVAVQHIANRVLDDHGLSGAFSLVVGAGIGDRMINDPRLPLISFTGSTVVGRRVAHTVAGRLGRTILELGGNNAIVVEPDADLELASRAILFAAVGTAGQRCTTARRLLVHKDVSSALLGRLLTAYKQVPVGDPLQSKTLMGPLVSAQAVEDMEKALKQAKAQGGHVLCGGRRLKNLGPQFVSPAIVKMPRQTAIVKEETFAPILYVLEYGTLEQAIAMHNDVPQGLSSAIFTDSVRGAERFLSCVGSDCGIANVNIGTSGAEIGGAFGGEKETGGGRESGSDAWKAYMRRQTNTINWSKELPLAQGIRFGRD